MFSLGLNIIQRNIQLDTQLDEQMFSKIHLANTNNHLANIVHNNSRISFAVHDIVDIARLNRRTAAAVVMFDNFDSSNSSHLSHRHTPDNEGIVFLRLNCGLSSKKRLGS